MIQDHDKKKWKHFSFFLLNFPSEIGLSENWPWRASAPPKPINKKIVSFDMVDLFNNNNFIASFEQFKFFCKA